MTARITSLWQEFTYILGVRFDPERDADELPVCTRTDAHTHTQTRTATITAEDVHEDSAGKMYARTTEMNDSGDVLPTWDAGEVLTGTNVPAQATKYDLEVFRAYKAQDKYRFFDWLKYQKVKELAFSKSKDGKPISYREAAKIPRIKAMRGCGERRLADYYKAMNEAQELYLKSLPRHARGVQ